MTLCQNGWRGLSHAECTRWTIPGTGRVFTMAPGPAGFILAHTTLFFHERVERLDLGTVMDDWSYAWRPIRGTTTTLSNHAGYAVDLNATRHPRGIPTNATFTGTQRRRIRTRMAWLRAVVRWGGDYKGTPDGMHFEIVGRRATVTAVAVMLKRTPRGRRVMAANPRNKW